jgi:hypothetical protein
MPLWRVTLVMGHLDLYRNIRFSRIQNNKKFSNHLLLYCLSPFMLLITL